MTDETLLIAELRKGSRYAFKKLYDLYAVRLYAFGLRYSQSREATQELVEDTFVWLWNNKEGIREVDNLRPILFVRMKHFLLNSYRSKLRSPQFKTYLDCQEMIGTDTPDKSLEYDDFVRLLQKALQQMPYTQRRVIELIKMEGMTIREVAEQLQLTEQTVRNQLSLGLKLLRKIIGTTHMLFYGVLFFVNNL